MDPESTGGAVFTRAETRTLEAVLRRLIPNDEHGPGAMEAGVLTYIKQALAGESEPLHRLYLEGLDSLEARAAERYGSPFAELETVKQDAVLREFENSPFFEMVREHTLQGMFGDPAYGGNVGLAGWDLLDFPGVRTSVPAEEQALDVIVKPARTARGDLNVVRRQR